MRVTDRQLYSDIRALHVAYALQSQAVEKSIQSATSIEDLADTIYALRESKKFLDHIAKEVGKMLTLAEKLCCVAWIHRNNPENIKTKYCTASPNIKQGPKIPREGSPEYEKLLEFYKVPSGTPFRPHWPALRDRISDDIKNGRPIPDGINPHEMVPSYVVQTRKKGDVLDEGEIPTDPDLVAEMVATLKECRGKAIHDLITQLQDMSAVLEAIGQPSWKQKTRDDAQPTSIAQTSTDGRPSFINEEDEESMF